MLLSPIKDRLASARHIVGEPWKASASGANERLALSYERIDRMRPRTSFIEREIIRHNETLARNAERKAIGDRALDDRRAA